MSLDLKREALRHMVATVAYRGGLSITNVPAGFATFRPHETTRTPGEILSHIGDLLQGSLHLVKGEIVYLNSPLLAWDDEVARFFTAAKDFDSYLASEAPLAYPVERFIQGPIGDALTHVGQIVMLRRMAGKPIAAPSYFTAEIVAGEISAATFAATANAQTES